MVEHLRQALVLDLGADGAGDRRPHAQGQDIPQGRGIDVGADVDGVERDPPPASRRRTGSRCRAGGRRCPGSAGSPRRTSVPGAKRSMASAIAPMFSCRSMLRAVVEEAAPLRIEPHEIEIIGEVASGLGEDAFQHPRHGQDRRAHVEAEARFVENRRLAAEPGILVVKRDPMAARRRDAGRRQSAQVLRRRPQPNSLERSRHPPAWRRAPSLSGACPCRVGSRNGMIHFKMDHDGLGGARRSCEAPAGPALGSRDRSRPIREAA